MCVWISLMILFFRQSEGKYLCEAHTGETSFQSVYGWFEQIFLKSIKKQICLKLSFPFSFLTPIDKRLQSLQPITIEKIPVCENIVGLTNAKMAEGGQTNWTKSETVNHGRLTSSLKFAPQLQLRKSRCVKRFGFDKFRWQNVEIVDGSFVNEIGIEKLWKV